MSGQIDNNRIQTVKASELSHVTGLTGGEIFIILQGGQARKATASDLATLIAFDGTGLNNKQDKEPGKGLSEQNYTLAEKMKVATFISHFRGKYTTVEGLRNTVVIGVDGDFAIVGGGSVAQFYIWDSEHVAWVQPGTLPQALGITDSPTFNTAHLTELSLSKHLGSSPSTTDSGQLFEAYNSDLPSELRVISFGQKGNSSYIRAFLSGGLDFYMNDAITVQATLSPTGVWKAAGYYVGADAVALSTDINAIYGGVPSDGDNMLKLYNKIVSGFSQVSVANTAERDAYNVAHLPLEIFVIDDGDGKWALYKALTTGVAATFIKISDPDLLNAVMTNVQIKAAYEANSNTNAFTDALLAKLNGVASGATANSADATLLARTSHTGTQPASTISDFASAANSLIGNVVAGLGYTDQIKLPTDPPVTYTRAFSVHRAFSLDSWPLDGSVITFRCPDGLWMQLLNNSNPPYPSPALWFRTGATVGGWSTWLNLTPTTAAFEVATYAAMIANGTPAVMTTYKVAADEDKSYTNSTYIWWPSGKRVWVATTDDN